MSYGAPPPPPPPPGWPGAGYGGTPAWSSGSPQPPAVPYAHWGKRVAAYLIDGLIGFAVMIVPFVIAAVALATGSHETVHPDGTDTFTVSGAHVALGIAFFALAVLALAAFFVWNVMLKEGRTGYSVGKGIVGIRLVREATGQPVGPWLALARKILHVLDSAICDLGYLWPLWDPKRQTFADKVASTIVLDQPRHDPVSRTSAGPASASPRS